MTDLYLIAHVVNAISLDTAEVEMEVAYQTPTGEWFTNDGMQVWPIWTQEIEFVPAIPEGWIEHLHEIAGKRKQSALNIRALLPKVTGPTIRRRL